MDADYIIVGAGSAGCVLADRLSEDGRTSVLVLEYGGSDMGPFIQMPAALSYPMGMRRYDWGYISDPEPHLGGRRIPAPRGKVLGGTSSINGMVYVRGHPCDFDHWEEAGAKGWGFRHVAPYFQRLENAHGGEEGWRGKSGPMHVTRGPSMNPLYKAFIEAGRHAGYPLTDDYNGSRQEGFGPMEMTVWKGRRWSAANACLRPAMRRRNLNVLGRAFVERVIMDGKRATGVVFRRRGRRLEVRAHREVILSASAFNSPKILMHSGIGDGEKLKAAGVEPVHHLPGVGQNLQDHLELYLQQESIQPITLFSHWNLWGKARIGAQWLSIKTGLGATNHFEACAFIRSRPGVKYPDIEYHFLPFAVRYDGKVVSEGHGFQVHAGPMLSQSRGRVALNGPDPQAPPSILFNYMSEPKDWEDFRILIRLTREIFGQEAFAPYRGREIVPGEHVIEDEALDDFIRHAVESAYHPCGTCRMGDPADPATVVDPECRVVGVEGLRVIDSSIFPRITNGNINAPSLMAGEKGADHVLGREPLSPFERQPWINPEWEASQR